MTRLFSLALLTVFVMAVMDLSVPLMSLTAIFACRVVLCSIPVQRLPIAQVVGARPNGD